MKWWPVNCQKQFIQLKSIKCVGGPSFAYKNYHNSGKEEATAFEQNQFVSLSKTAFEQNQFVSLSKTFTVILIFNCLNNA